jgi:hypothetical protein
VVREEADPVRHTSRARSCRSARVSQTGYLSRDHRLSKHGEQRRCSLPANRRMLHSPSGIPTHCSCWRWDTNEEGRLPFRPNDHVLLTYVYFLSATKNKELEKLGHVASLIKGGGIGTGWDSTHITGKTLRCPDHSSNPSICAQCCACPGTRHLWALQSLFPTRCSDPASPALRVPA